MMKFMRLGHNKYGVLCEDLDVRYTGSLYECAAVMDYCGVPTEEIEFALAEFDRKGDDIADFGVNKTLTFTAKMPKAA